MPPLPGPIPRPPGVESEIAHSRHEEQERDWARRRDEDRLEPHRLLRWWRRLFGDPAFEDNGRED
jgi:hypothetical protein